MSYKLENRLVIGLASSALFDLSESDNIFQQEGEEKYRLYQQKHQFNSLNPGVAFPFIRRLLSLNILNPESPLVEVILLSRNDPDTGMRVMNSIKNYGLNITRAAFLQGGAPYKYIPSFDIELFLSANEKDVNQAIKLGHPAGHILNAALKENPEDQQLRIAFDFDGVIADDEAEKVYQSTKDISKFHDHEQKNKNIPHNPGPLKNFLQRISDIQQIEIKKKELDSDYQPIIKVSIVTARNAPSHERVINTMRSWGITVNEAFFMGGIEKTKVLKIIDPHIFFDDQKTHLEQSADMLPSVHIPFGIANGN